MTRLSIALAILLAAVPAFAQDWTPRHRHDWSPHRHRGANVNFGHDYALAAGETAPGAVIVVGGSAVIDGQADEDVVVIGGDLRVGPTAAIGGDAVDIGGHSQIDPMAAITGEVRNVAVELPRIDVSWLPWKHSWFPLFAIGFTVVRLAVLLACALMITAIFPASVARVSTQVADAPGQAVLSGLGLQVLLVPALAAVAIALVISVVGIPLLLALPVLAALCIGLSMAGFTGTLAHAGAALRGRPDAPIPRIADVYIGMCAIAALTIAGEIMTLGPAWLYPFAIAFRAIGLCVEYAAWTMGTGAALAALFGRRDRQSIPTRAPAPTML